MRISRLYIPLFALQTAACVPTSKVQTSKTLDVYGAGVIQNPVVADLDVSPAKVSASVTDISSTPLDVMKASANAEALKNAKADVLVEPVYTTESSGTKKTVTVSGYPGTYKNFRPVTSADLPLLEAGVMQKAKTAEPTTVQKKKGQGALGVGIIVGVLLIAALVGGGG